MCFERSTRLKHTLFIYITYEVHILNLRKIKILTPIDKVYELKMKYGKYPLPSPLTLCHYSIWTHNLKTPWLVRHEAQRENLIEWPDTEVTDDLSAPPLFRGIPFFFGRL